MNSVCLIIVLLSFVLRGGAQIFSSVGELTNVFKMEEELVQVLRSQKARLEASLESIRDYSDEVRTMYEKEDCWPVKEKCPDQKLVERIIGNPIYNYQVLKRLNVFFKKVEDSTKAIDTKKTLSEIRKIRTRYGGLPTETDLQGAAKALNRLQEIYRLNVTEFAQGNIFGLQTAAELSVKDTFYLGRYAMMNDRPETALRWLEEAVLQAAMDSSNNITAGNTVKTSQIEQAIKQVERKLPPGFRDLMEEEDSDSGYDDEDEDDEGAESHYRLYHIPPKTYDPKKFTTLDDEINYKALCQGKQLQPVKTRSQLTCFYDDLGLKAYVIGPVKKEVLHDDPHRMILFHDFIHDREIEGLIGKAKPRIATATTGQDKIVSDLRVSKNTWLEDGFPGVEHISRRINRVTGLQTTRSLDAHSEGKKEEYEQLQIANYGIGGHYGTHQDPMYVYKEPDYMAKLGDQDEYITGDRMATFMLYLSDVSLGGNTAFPRLGLSIAPERGAAVFWHNIKRSGRTDMAMLHGGCPVLLGSKWVANKWVREAANIFTRPCVGNIDN